MCVACRDAFHRPSSASAATWVFYKEVGMAFDGVTDLAEATKGAFEWPNLLEGGGIV
jgi:hypothetical protein